MPTYPKKKRIRVEADYEPLARLGPYPDLYLPRPTYAYGVGYYGNGTAVPPLIHARRTSVPPPEVVEVNEPISAACLPATPSSTTDLENFTTRPVEPRLDFSISLAENIAYLETTGSSNGQNPFGLVNREMLSGEQESAQANPNLAGDLFARFKSRVYTFFVPQHYPIRFFDIEKPVYTYPQDIYVDGESSTVHVRPDIPGYSVEFSGNDYYYGEVYVTVNEDFGRMSYEFLHTPNPGNTFQAVFLGDCGGSGNMVFDTGCMPDSIDPNAPTTTTTTLEPGATTTTTTLEPGATTTTPEPTTTISPTESFFEDPEHPYSTLPKTDVTHPDFGSYLEYMPYGMYQISVRNGISYMVNLCKIHDRNDFLTFFEPGAPPELYWIDGVANNRMYHTPSHPLSADINNNRLPDSKWNYDFIWSELENNVVPPLDVEACKFDYFNNVDFWYDSAELLQRSSLANDIQYGGNSDINLTSTVLLVPQVVIDRVVKQEARLLAKGIPKQNISRAMIYISFFRDAGNTIVDTILTDRGNQVMGDYSAYQELFWVKQFIGYDTATILDEETFDPQEGCAIKFHQSGVNTQRHDRVNRNSYYFWANYLGYNANPG